MLNQQFKTYIVAISLILLSSRQGYAQYCQVSGDGHSSINLQTLELPKTIQNDYLKLVEELKSLGQKLAKTKEEILILTAKKSNPKAFSVKEAKVHLTALNAKILNLVEKIPNTHRKASQELIEGYFQVTDRLLLIEILDQPQNAKLSKLQSDYSLNLPGTIFDKIYPLGLNLSEGIEATFNSNKNNSSTYTLSFSGENIFRALVRGAAQSPKNIKNGSAYFETVRCGLNRILIGKTKINQALLGKEQDKLNISNDTRVCLNTPVQDFENLSKSDVEIRKEKSLRALLSAELPQLFVNLSEESISIFTETRLGEFIAQFRLFPDWLSELNNNKGDADPEVTPAMLAQVSAEIDTQIENEYQRLPLLKSLRGVWAESSMVTIFNNLIESCNYNLSDSLGKSLDKKILIEKLVRAEDFYFFNNLANDLESLNVRLTKMQENEISILLKEFIISRKIIAINQALIPVLNYFSTSTSPDLDTLLAALQADLKPAAEQIIDSRLKKSELNKYVNTLSQIAKQKNTNASSHNLLLESFTLEMMTAAKKIKTYLDEKTKISELPLDKSALIRSFQPSLSQISRENSGRVYILAAEKDFNIQKNIWLSMKAKLNSDIQKFGVDCKPIDFTSRAQIWGKGLFEDARTSRARESSQRDCDLLNIFAGALGLERQTPFSKFSDIHANLAAKMTEDELASFVSIYRNELTSDLFGEFRLLDMKIENTSKNNIKLYEILADAKNPKDVLDLVRTGIRNSLKPLSSHLEKVSSSKTEADLDFFIKRTRIINALLGEGDLSALTSSLNGYNALSYQISDIMAEKGFVFPQLIKYHSTLQEKMVADEGLRDEVYEEFLTSNIYISMGVLGGWAAKHAFGVMPAWLGLPRLSSVIHSAGQKLSHTIDGHGWFLMGIIAGHIGSLEIKKSEFRTELRHINELTQSETLKPEGAENPLPLIEWSDYKQQFTYYESGIKTANLNQLMDLGWLAFPFIMNKAIQQGLKKMSSGLIRQNAKFEVSSVKDRKFYESRTEFILNHRKTLLRSAFSELKNPKSLDVIELQIARDNALRQTTSAAKRARINDSYEKIIKEFGSRIESVIEHPTLLESYSKAMFGEYGTPAQAYRFYQEFRNIMLESKVAL